MQKNGNTIQNSEHNLNNDKTNFNGNTLKEQFSQFGQITSFQTFGDVENSPKNITKIHQNPEQRSVNVDENIQQLNLENYLTSQTKNSENHNLSSRVFQCENMETQHLPNQYHINLPIITEQAYRRTQFDISKSFLYAQSKSLQTNLISQTEIEHKIFQQTNELKSSKNCQRKTQTKKTVRFIGTIQNNKKEGYCVEIYNDQSAFRGFFNNNKKLGYGVYQTANAIYKGYYYMNQPVGYFLKVGNNEEIVVCEIINDQFVPVYKRKIDNFEVQGRLDLDGNLYGIGSMLCGRFSLLVEFVKNRIKLQSKAKIEDQITGIFYEGTLHLNPQKEGLFISDYNRIFRVSLNEKMVEDMRIII